MGITPKNQNKNQGTQRSAANSDSYTEKDKKKGNFNISSFEMAVVASLIVFGVYFLFLNGEKRASDRRDEALRYKESEND